MELALQFEAINDFTSAEKQIVRDLLEGLILNHVARHWDARNTANPATGEQKAKQADK